MALRFSWDPVKAASNRRKHHLSFTEAATAFGDHLSITIPDPDHSASEQRFLLIGLTRRGRHVVVAHVERDDEIRIINARFPTRHERRTYEEDK